jgi:hypothetical protein
MGEYVGFLRELIPTFFPVVFVASGDQYEGKGYYRAFVEAIPRDVRQKCIFVVGHECIPQQKWTTRQYCDAVLEMRAALDSGEHMAMHGGDGRLSFASNPIELDDPFIRWNAEKQEWESGEVRDWRSDIGAMFTFYFHQAANMAEGTDLNPNHGGIPERMKECCTRVDGTHWQNAPDWFAGLGRRPIPVLWETSEEWAKKKWVSRAWMLEMSKAGLAMGYRGYGCGEGAIPPAAL